MQSISFLCPQAKILIHKTWAYEIDSTHGEFPLYHNNQEEMQEKITEAYQKAAEDAACDLIPVGDVIDYLRHRSDAFCREKGGLPLTRDGFHLSLDYGRYAAALTWYGVLFGEVTKPAFIPSVEGLKTDPRLIEEIRSAVKTVLKQNRLIR